MQAVPEENAGGGGALQLALTCENCWQTGHTSDFCPLPKLSDEARDALRGDPGLIQSGEVPAPAEAQNLQLEDLSEAGNSVSGNLNVDTGLALQLGNVNHINFKGGLALQPHNTIPINLEKGLPLRPKNSNFLMVSANTDRPTTPREHREHNPYHAVRNFSHRNGEPCHNCWLTDLHTEKTCPRASRGTVFVREMARKELRVPMTKIWRQILRENNVQPQGRYSDQKPKQAVLVQKPKPEPKPKPLRFPAKLQICYNCWATDGHKVTECIETRLHTQEREDLRVMLKARMDCVWKAHLDKRGIVPKLITDPRTIVETEELPDPETAPELQCWNCWEETHDEENCPKGLLKVAYREALRLELGAPRPLDEKYDIELASITCKNCWLSTLHRTSDCPEECLETHEREVLRAARGVPMCPVWETILNLEGITALAIPPTVTKAKLRTELPPHIKAILGIRDPNEPLPEKKVPAEPTPEEIAEKEEKARQAKLAKEEERRIFNNYTVRPATLADLETKKFVFGAYIDFCNDLNEQAPKRSAVWAARRGETPED